MIVPQYWAEARIKKRINGRPVTIKRFGWSDDSESDAQLSADHRAKEAMSRVESGQTVNRFEPKIPYNGAEGVPIREEVVRRSRDAVITRNSYGALCINTPNVLFADVDFEKEPGFAYHLFTLALLTTTLFIFAPVLVSSVEFLWLAGLIVVLSITTLVDLIFRLSERMSGGAQKRAIKRIRAFSKSHPMWHLRLYRTPAGYRVLVMDKTFDPNGKEALDFFRALKSDPIYVRMCQNQRCFRARVSPKPWRIGIDTRMKPRPGVWPINPARMPDRVKWVERYERIAANYASCRFEEKLGSGRVDPSAENVRSIHDNYCQADTKLVIA